MQSERNIYKDRVLYLNLFFFLNFPAAAVNMGLKSDDDKRPSKLAIMDDDVSDKPSKCFHTFFIT